VGETAPSVQLSISTALILTRIEHRKPYNSSISALSFPAGAVATPRIQRSQWVEILPRSQEHRRHYLPGIDPPQSSSTFNIGDPQEIKGPEQCILMGGKEMENSDIQNEPKHVTQIPTDRPSLLFRLNPDNNPLIRISHWR